MSRHLPRRGAETHFPLVMWTDGRGPQNNAVSVRICCGTFKQLCAFRQAGQLEVGGAGK